MGLRALLLGVGVEMQGLDYRDFGVTSGFQVSCNKQLKDSVVANLLHWPASSSRETESKT